MASTNNDELLGKSNELLLVPPISSKDKYISVEYGGVVYNSEDGCVGGDIGSFLLGFACSLRVDSANSIIEASIRIFKVGGIYVVSDLKNLTHSFGQK